MLKKLYLLFFFTAIFAFNQIFAGTAMIVDTDMGTDDWLALAYLLKKPDVDIKAISIVTTGLSHCKPGIEMAGALLKLTRHKNIPIACGPNTPLHGHNHFPAWLRDKINHHFGLAIPKKQHIDIRKNAIQLMYQTLAKNKQKITILAIGPLTNLALLLQRHPNIKAKIKRIYFLGGAIQVPGNITSLIPNSTNHVAEWNIYIDAYAAKDVLNSGVPLTFIPLDASNRVRLNINFYHALTQQANTPIAHFVHAVLQKNLAFIKSNQFYFWDPLAAVISASQGFYTAKTNTLSLTLKSGKNYANLLVSKHGRKTQWVNSVNASLFKHIYLKQLNS